MKVFFTFVALCSVLAGAQQSTGQQLSNPTANPLAQSALRSLIGKTLYSCRVYPADSVYGNMNPRYFRAETAAGQAISDADLVKRFPTGAKLQIVGAKFEPEFNRQTPAEIVGGLQFPAKAFLGLSITVKNTETGDIASVEMETEPNDLKPPRLFPSISDGGWFTRHPVRFPEIGMSEADVHCSIGFPEHENTDAIGDDQLVYDNGDLLIYVNHRTGRVTDIQMHQ
jgi:hypothetical protein